MRLRSLLSVVSLLLCAGTAVLWIWSRFDRWDLAYFDERQAVDRRTDVRVYEVFNLPDILEVGYEHARREEPFGPLRSNLRLGQVGVLKDIQFRHRQRTAAIYGEQDGFLDPIGFWVRFFKDPQPPSPLLPGYWGFRVAAPHWSLVIAFGAMPLIEARRWRRARRRRVRARAGCCTECGFDLRASTSRCPECGTPIIAAPKYRRKIAAR